MEIRVSIQTFYTQSLLLGTTVENVISTCKHWNIIWQELIKSKLVTVWKGEHDGINKCGTPFKSYLLRMLLFIAAGGTTL